MTVQVHDLYAVTFANAGAAVRLGGIVSQSITPGDAVAGEQTDGEVYPQLSTVNASGPGATFATLSLSQALGLCGLGGRAITQAPAEEITLYDRLHLDGGSRAGGSTNRSFEFLNGILIPRTLSVDHQGNGSISYELTSTSVDGSTSPLTISEAVALPALPDVDDRYTLGPLTIGGVAIDSVKSFSLDFGLQVVPEGGDSTIFPTFVSIRAGVPTLTWSGIDATWFSAAKVPLLGLAGTNANTIQYLRKRSPGGTFVADVTAEHISIAANGIATVSTLSGQTNSPKTVSIQLRTNQDPSNSPVLISTEVAIP